MKEVEQIFGYDTTNPFSYDCLLRKSFKFQCENVLELHRREMIDSMVKTNLFYYLLIN